MHTQQGSALSHSSPSATPRRLVKLFLALAAIAAVSLGCGPEEVEVKTHSKQEGKVAVKLPPVPDLDKYLNYQRTYPDGSLTITGLILDRQDHLGTDIQVRGFVRGVSLDCPFLTDPEQVENKPKEGERELRECKSLFFTIADTPDSPKDLLMVGYRPFFHPHLKPGMEVVAKGRYDIDGLGFMRGRDGLMVVSEVLNMAVDPKGELFTEPEDIQRVKAEWAEIQPGGPNGGMPFPPPN